MAVSQFFILIVSVIKIFSLLKVSNEKVSKVLLMMGAVHSQIKVYIRLLISWVFITSLALRILGVKFEGDQDVTFLGVLSGIFKGFVGDIQNIEVNQIDQEET
jgi:hypothetical protein